MNSTQKKSAATDVTAISWTGGKDCNLALLYATRDPALDVQYLITFRPEGQPFRAHPLPFMEAQANSLGLKLIYVVIPKNTTDYMKAYVDGIRNVKDEYGIKVIVTGDMDLVGTMERNWIERCCEQVGDGMRAYLPLWKKDRDECLNALLDEGFEIIFSCVKSPFFDGSWINRKLDLSALQEMKDIIDRGLTEDQIKRGVIKPLDLSGERGEYHTMCVNGPLYQKRVVVEVNCEPIREDIQNGTNWKGNIHNAESIWTISLKENMRIAEEHKIIS
jgi:diphthine-ammonia ligase